MKCLVYIFLLVCLAAIASSQQNKVANAECKATQQQDRLLYPLELPQLGVYNPNTTTAETVFNGAFLSVKNVHTPAVGSKSLMFEGDATIGYINGHIALENVGRCDVTEDGREFLYNFTATTPSRISVRLTPWKQIRVSTLYPIYSRNYGRLFSVVKHFPRSEDKYTVVSFSAKHRYARMDVKRFPLSTLMPAFKRSPVTRRLVMRDATVKSHFDFDAKQASKEKLFTTIRGYLDLKPVSKMFYGLRKIRSVRAKATFVQEGFELTVPLNDKIALVKNTLFLNDPEFSIHQKFKPHMSYKEVHEKYPVYYLVRGQVQLFKKNFDTELHLKESGTTLETTAHFGTPKRPHDVKIRGKARGNGPSTDFDLRAKFDDHLLRSLTLKANRALKKARRSFVKLSRNAEGVTQSLFQKVGFSFTPFAAPEHAATQEKIKKIESKIESGRKNLQAALLRLKEMVMAHKNKIKAERFARRNAPKQDDTKKVDIARLNKKLQAKERLLYRVTRKIKQLENSVGSYKNMTSRESKLNRIDSQIALLKSKLQAPVFDPAKLQKMKAKIQLRLTKLVEKQQLITRIPDKLAKLKAEIKENRAKLTALISSHQSREVLRAASIQKKITILSAKLKKADKAPHFIARLKQRVAELKALDPNNASLQKKSVPFTHKELIKYERRKARAYDAPQKIQKIRTALEAIEARINKITAENPNTHEVNTAAQQFHLVNTKLKQLRKIASQHPAIAAKISKLRTKLSTKIRNPANRASTERFIKELEKRLALCSKAQGLIPKLTTEVAQAKTRLVALKSHHKGVSSVRVFQLAKKKAQLQLLLKKQERLIKKAGAINARVDKLHKEIKTLPSAHPLHMRIAKIENRIKRLVKLHAKGGDLKKKINKLKTTIATIRAKDPNAAKVAVLVEKITKATLARTKLTKLFQRKEKIERAVKKLQRKLSKIPTYNPDVHQGKKARITAKLQKLKERKARIHAKLGRKTSKQHRKNGKVVPGQKLGKTHKHKNGKVALPEHKHKQRKDGKVAKHERNLHKAKSHVGKNKHKKQQQEKVRLVQTQEIARHKLNVQKLEKLKQLKTKLKVKIEKIKEEILRNGGKITTVTRTNRGQFAKGFGKMLVIVKNSNVHKHIAYLRKLVKARAALIRKYYKKFPTKRTVADHIPALPSIAASVNLGLAAQEVEEVMFLRVVAKGRLSKVATTGYVPKVYVTVVINEKRRFKIKTRINMKKGINAFIRKVIRRAAKVARVTPY